MQKINRIALVSFENEIAWGLRSIAQSLRCKGLNVILYFLERYSNIPQGVPENTLYRFIEEFNPGPGDIVGISFTTPYYNTFCLLAEKLRPRRTLVVAGGIHPTIQSDSCLPFSDYVIQGSGEYAMLELLKELQSETTPPEKGVYCKNNAVWFTEDVGELPYPRYGDEEDVIIVNGKATRTKEVPRRVGFVTRYQTFTSFGCPYRCSYCVNVLLQRMTGRSGKNFLRRRRIETVIEELKHVKDRIDTVSFEDEDFLINEQRVIEFLDIYQKEINIPFSCLVTPKTLKPETMDHLVHRLKKAKCVSVTIGLQSASDRTSKIFCRAFDLDHLKLVAQAFSRHNILVRYDIILSNPFEDELDVSQTVHAVLALPHPYEVNIFYLTFFPGYDITAKAQEMGIPVEVGGDTRTPSGAEAIAEKIIRLAEIPFISRKYLTNLYDNRSEEWAQKKSSRLERLLIPLWRNRFITILRIAILQPTMIFFTLNKKILKIAGFKK